MINKKEPEFGNVFLAKFKIASQMRRQIVKSVFGLTALSSNYFKIEKRKE